MALLLQCVMAWSLLVMPVAASTLAHGAKTSSVTTMTMAANMGDEQHSCHDAADLSVGCASMNTQPVHCEEGCSEHATLCSLSHATHSAVVPFMWQVGALNDSDTPMVDQRFDLANAHLSGIDRPPKL
jgi:hypothetical protein